MEAGRTHFLSPLLAQSEVLNALKWLGGWDATIQKFVSLANGHQVSRHPAE
jgi:hypothetical protein